MTGASIRGGEATRGRGGDRRYMIEEIECLKKEMTLLREHVTKV